MVIAFDAPVFGIFVTMGADSTTPATARFFGPDGSLLTEMTGSVGGAFLPTEFYLEDAPGPGIARVEIEYEDTDVPEALLLVVADFVEPPSFRRCVAQVAHGPLGSDSRTLQTSLSLTVANHVPDLRIPGPFEQMLSVEFRDRSGAPLNVQLDGEINSRFDYSLYLESKIVRTTDSVSGLDQGYACVSSDYPFNLAAVYRILDADGRPVSEAGIDGTKPGHRFVGVFEKEMAEETNTALAIANVSDRETTTAISFFLAPATTFQHEVVLGPGEQGAWFVDEIAPELADRDAEGAVEISSPQSVVATILRTIRGVVSASLPLDRTQTGDRD
ncbi:MAG: hypothetical protein WAO20_14525 [Acidobacteriota bacterium]